MSQLLLFIAITGFVNLSLNGKGTLNIISQLLESHGLPQKEMKIYMTIAHVALFLNGYLVLLINFIIWLNGITNKARRR
jgi:hypothetical protein